MVWFGSVKIPGGLISAHIDTRVHMIHVYSTRNNTTRVYTISQMHKRLLVLSPYVACFITLSDLIDKIRFLPVQSRI